MHGDGYRDLMKEDGAYGVSGCRVCCLMEGSGTYSARVCYGVIYWWGGFLVVEVVSVRWMDYVYG